MKEYYKNTNYIVYEDGRIWSKPRLGTKGGFLKVRLNKKGYQVVMLGKERKPIRVHRMVALMYIPNPHNKPFVNHIDGVKTNNHYSNLEWVTNKENIAHAWSMGLSNAVRGENNQQSKLTNEQAQWIRDNYVPRHKEFGTRALGRKFGIAHTKIVNVIKGYSYKV